MPGNRLRWAVCLALATLACAPIQAQVVQEYGDEDLSNTGVYPNDPKIGATLYGLLPGVSTLANQSYSHSYPFSPSPGDYPGTDQIYVGSVQTSNHDGYSNASERINGPQVITLDYGALLPAGQTIQTLTLGLGADDFQFRTFGQPFTATINGSTDVALTNALNALDQTGPYTQFLTVGIDPVHLTSNNVLTLSIDEGGDGGDGWALDYLTVGLTFTPSAPVPEPGTYALLLSLTMTGTGFLARRRHARKAA